MLNITAYVDGSSSGNPGPSGCGIILTNKTTGLKRELSIPICHASGNMSELIAAHEAMLACKTPHITHLTIYTDSKYVIDICTKKINTKTVTYLISMVRKNMKNFHKITWKHVPGHSGDVMNTRADELAKNASKKAKQESNHHEPLSKPRIIGFINGIQ